VVPRQIHLHQVRSYEVPTPVPDHGHANSRVLETGTPTKEGSMNVGLMVKVYGPDERGRDVSGMTGTIVALAFHTADVALVAWGGEVVRVERVRLIPLDPQRKTVQQVKREQREDWVGSNAR